ncbi:MAG: ThuA domain-containing protein [Planctomycetota bacterium]|nr:ThuA domain-containing protein [Planctomycetota bacterium]
MSKKTSKGAPAVAVVTGGHSFDVPDFHRLFRAITGVDSYIQHMDDFASSPREVRQSYDAILFYIMLMDGPRDDGQPWYAGKPKTALEELGGTEQGIFVLHHAILAYPQWPAWSEIVGISDRKFGYHDGQALHVAIASPAHPITKGLRPWDMTDETYTMADAGTGSEILLTVEHPRSMKTVGWTRQYRKSRVFNFQSGHDNVAWSDPSFREVVRRGALWCAGRL